ncbi:MAG: FtsQ-type POTRA domain-containing protein [Elusimicrobiota bacterium]
MRKHRVRVRLKTKIERSKKRKTVLIKTTVVIVLFTVLSFAVNKISKFLLTSPIFNVKSVEIKGNDITDKSAVLSYLDFDGKNIFLLKLENTGVQLEEKFLAIKNIKINRHLPNKIIAEIGERIPLAEITVQNKRVGIDENLKLFVLPENYRVLAKISDNLTLENKTACLKFLKDVSGLPVYKEIKGITAVSPDDIIFFIENDCKICIGAVQNIEQKISYLEKVLADLETKGKKAQYINMRDFSGEYKEIVVRAK